MSAIRVEGNLATVEFSRFDLASFEPQSGRFPSSGCGKIVDSKSPRLLVADRGGHRGVISMQGQYTLVPGDRIGQLTIVSDAGVVRGHRSWVCQCDCGKTATIRAANLRSGNTSSCGCQRVPAAQAATTTHGRTNSSAYWRWRAMIQRCTNPRNRAWKDYGGRGIRVCDRWRTFENFYADMGDPPPGATLDRVNSDGNYELGNCRWASKTEQARNRRNTPMLAYGGETLSYAEWAARMGVSVQTIHGRVRGGWSVEQTLGIAPPPPTMRGRRGGRACHQ
jgi:hypothetical protein